MTTVISGFSEYQTPGSSLKCCLIPAITALAQTGATSEVLNALIQDSSSTLFALSNDGSFIQSVLDRSIQVINQSTNVQALVLRNPSVELFFTRKAWDLVGGFSNDTKSEEVIVDFIEKAKLVRTTTFIELHSAGELRHRIHGQDYIKNAAVRSGTNEAELNFHCSGMTFKCEYSPNRHLPGVPELKRDEQELQGKMNLALTHLSNNNCDAAVQLIKEVTAHRNDIPELFFAQAIAQSRLGLNEDALRSLISLLERDSNHQQGRQALQELRQALKLT